MHMTIDHIERLTSQQLRKLPMQPLAREKFDEGIYDQENVLDLEDNDEITPEECGFMLGYLESD